MRVAYNAILLGSYFSGVEVTISTLGSMLSLELGKDFYVFLNGHVKDQFHFPGATCHYAGIPAHNRLSRILWEHFSLARQARELGCDLLHCPGYIAPFNTDIPTVVTVHDAIALLHPELCKVSNRIYYRAFHGRSVARASQIIVPSTTVKEQLVRLFNADPAKINVIPFAPASVFRKVEDKELLSKVRKKFSLPEKFILSVANHEPKKNIPGAIRAFAGFKKKVPGYKLVLAGRRAWGTDETGRLLRELNLAGDVIRTGYVPFNELPALYSLADIFLFPSLDEGFGIPILEAMACGTPVVCSDRGALPETAGGAAACMPPDDFPGMAEALANFAGNMELRKDFVGRGLKRTGDLSWEKTARATLDVYRKVKG